MKPIRNHMAYKIKYLLYCTPIIPRDHPIVIVTPDHGSDCLIMSLHMFQIPALTSYIPKQLMTTSRQPFKLCT
jgi:hypothetical protein